MVLTLLRALSGVRDLLVTVAHKSSACTFSISPGMPRPHDFAVRQRAARQACALASIASRPTFVTTRTPLVSRRDGQITSMISAKKKTDSINQNNKMWRTLNLLGNFLDGGGEQGG